MAFRAVISVAAAQFMPVALAMDSNIQANVIDLNSLIANGIVHFQENSQGKDVKKPVYTEQFTGGYCPENTLGRARVYGMFREYQSLNKYPDSVANKRYTYWLENVKRDYENQRKNFEAKKGKKKVNKKIQKKKNLLSKKKEKNLLKKKLKKNKSANKKQKLKKVYDQLNKLIEADDTLPAGFKNGLLAALHAAFANMDTTEKQLIRIVQQWLEAYLQSHIAHRNIKDEYNIDNCVVKEQDLLERRVMNNYSNYEYSALQGKKQRETYQLEYVKALIKFIKDKTEENVIICTKYCRACKDVMAFVSFMDLLELKFSGAPEEAIIAKRKEIAEKVKICEEEEEKQKNKDRESFEKYREKVEAANAPVDWYFSALTSEE